MSFEGVVTAFRAVDDSDWIHPKGMETARHAIGHFHDSASRYYSLKGLDFLGLAGIAFEASVRLIAEVEHDEHLHVVLEDMIDVGIREMRCGSIPALLAQEAWVHRLPISNLVLRFEDKKFEGIEEELREAIPPYVGELMRIAMRAARLTASHQSYGASEIDRDPWIVKNILREAAEARIAYLLGKNI